MPQTAFLAVWFWQRHVQIAGTPKQLQATPLWSVLGNARDHGIWATECAASQQNTVKTGQTPALSKGNPQLTAMVSIESVVVGSETQWAWVKTLFFLRKAFSSKRESVPPERVHWRARAPVAKKNCPSFEGAVFCWWRKTR